MSRQASGLQAWALQRASALYLLLFFPYLLWYFLSAPPANHGELQAWVASPWVMIGLLLFVVSLLVHAWVGFRDVLIDYVKPPAIRIGLLMLLGFGLVACGLWAAQVIFLAQR